VRVEGTGMFCIILTIWTPSASAFITMAGLELERSPSGVTKVGLRTAQSR
jgi:hypothetical protein